MVFKATFLVTWLFVYFVVGSCRQKRQLLMQKIVNEQRRLLGKAVTSTSQNQSELSSSTFLADDDSLLLSEGDTGLYWFSFSVYFDREKAVVFMFPVVGWRPIQWMGPENAFRLCICACKHAWRRHSSLTSSLLWLLNNSLFSYFV